MRLFVFLAVLYFLYIYPIISFFSTILFSSYTLNEFEGYVLYLVFVPFANLIHLYGVIKNSDHGFSLAIIFFVVGVLFFSAYAYYLSKKRKKYKQEIHA